MQNGSIRLFGNNYRFEELRNSVCDMSIIAGIKPYTLFDGPERGVFAVDVWTGAGLQYTVVPDRGMNICNVKYRGIPLDWTSGTAVTSPFLYDSKGWNWLRSFHGGLVHTCGLCNVGGPCFDKDIEYDNRDFGGHGRISNTSAQELGWRTEDMKMIVTGKCRIVSATEENLVLERSITSELGEKRILLKDKITNMGWAVEPVLLLYHCNFGFPILSGDSKLILPAKTATDWEGRSVQDFTEIKGPTDVNYDEVNYPDIEGDSVKITVYNPKIGNNGIGVYLKYSKKELPFLTIWKHYQKRAYVMGVEPGTCRVEGRITEKQKKRAILLEKDESIDLHLEMGVVDECE